MFTVGAFFNEEVGPFLRSYKNIPTLARTTSFSLNFAKSINPLRIALKSSSPISSSLIIPWRAKVNSTAAGSNPSSTAISSTLAPCPASSIAWSSTLIQLS